MVIPNFGYPGFIKPIAAAKIIDFSHFFGTVVKTCYFRGGSDEYPGLEWRNRAPTKGLMLGDVYYFGTVFSTHYWSKPQLGCQLPSHL